MKILNRDVIQQKHMAKKKRKKIEAIMILKKSIYEPKCVSNLFNNR